jgi:acyl-CoA oxidase
LYVLNKAISELLVYEIISPTQSRWLVDAYRDEILQFSPREAVQITDAFGFTDYELGSILGRHDGKVYENLWEEVQKSPINSAPELKEEVLKMIHSMKTRESRL